MKKTAELTPLMKQFWDIKSLHHDKILLFRMGDFFEMFYDDAVKAAPILGITLTQRNKKSEDQTPMCGVPYHSISGPINKLLAAGLKVAICDQVEDPKLAKGLVKRAVTRILTPGMVYDSDTLEATQSHYIVSLDLNSISFIDTTTGESFYFNVQSFEQKLKLMQVLPVAEVVVNLNEKLFSEEQMDQIKKAVNLVSDFDQNTYLKTNEKQILKNEHEFIPLSAKNLKLYVLSLADENIEKVLKAFVEREIEHRLHLSQQTLRHLEIFSTYKGDEKGSFFQAINRTQTAAGARLLRQWVLFPLRNKTQIISRQNKVSFFREDMYLLKKIREVLSGMGDIERRVSKIAQPQCQARDLVSLAQSLNRAQSVYELTQQVNQIQMQNDLKSVDSHNLSSHQDKQNLSTDADDAKVKISVIQDLINEICNTILEDAPLTLKQGSLIKKGVSTELDEYIDLSTHAQSHIENLELREKEKTGINSLKVRYNNVFGYYIEITHLHKEKVPSHYQRKQTLANAERFCTDELIELEKKVLSAQTKRFELEYFIFDQLRQKVLQMASEILKLTSYCSEIDVLSSLAWLSLEESYCRPEFSQQNELRLQLSRHPVVEQFMRGKFVANSMNLAQGECYLITGPNMAGKSTLMRQVALTALLAQMGSYVPAESALLPLYDALFTRIGASDQLSEGLSTFMVEMTETAEMLKKATPNSLLILDEVGRGTATFDGLCLAQSILEHILQNVKAQVFFATHYHELTSMDKKFQQIKNVHMKIYDQKNKIEFLHLLSQGAAGQSYGIQVAELAGLPKTITQRAGELLNHFEKEPDLLVKKKLNSSKPQLSLFSDEDVEAQENELVLNNKTNLQKTEKSEAELKMEKLIQEFKEASVMTMSPLQALNQLAEWKQKYLN